MCTTTQFQPGSPASDTEAMTTLDSTETVERREVDEREFWANMDSTGDIICTVGRAVIDSPSGIWDPFGRLERFMLPRPILEPLGLGLREQCPFDLKVTRKKMPKGWEWTVDKERK